MQFNNGNNQSLINLSPSQKSFVDDTNKMFGDLTNPILKDYESYTNGSGWNKAIGSIMDFFNLGGHRDLRLQDFNRKLDIMLSNTAIRRRVADALQSGVNPIFALGYGGANSESVAHQPISKNDMVNSLLKLLIGLTFVMK